MEGMPLMFTIRVISSAQSSSLPSLYLSAEKSSLLGLIPGVNKIKLNYGIFQLDAEIKKVPESTIASNELVINAAICDKLYLRNGQMLHIRMTPQGELDLGPLVGYFISNEKMSKLKSGKYDTVYGKFFDLIRILGGEIFLFSLEDCNWPQLTVTGYVYNPDSPGELSAFMYPVPRVIYNRCLGPECKHQIEQLISRTSPFKNIIVTSPDINEFYNNTPSPPTDNFEPVKLLNCPTEATILVQKDYLGKWQYTYGALNLIPPIKIPTNFFGNFPLESGLKEIFPVDYRNVKDTLVASAVCEAEKVGENSPTFVDLEIKLVVNSKGKVRVQKVHAKPQKTLVTKFTGSIPAQLSIARPLHYCFKLAGFPLLHEPCSRPNKRSTITNQPTIGIFEELETCDEIKSKKPDIYEQLFTKASLELGCITYHFSIYDLHGTNCIQGCYYDPTKQQWVSQEFAWPGVLYDRATFELASERQAAKQFRKDLKRFGKTMFLNSRSVFGKGFTSNILEKMPLLSNYLPYNVNNPSPDTVQSLLEKYDSIFIKTEFGSNLEGVIKVVRHKQSCVISSKLENRPFPDFEQMWSYIRDFVGAEDFVTQQGINTAVYKSEHPLNVRSIVQKNGKGMWEAALVKPWIATIPELRGFPLQWAEAFGNLFSSTKTDNIHAEICSISLVVAKTLEAHSGHLGELGIDFVIDSSGHPWVIEVNGKTNKFFFIKDEIPDTYYKLYYNPLAYSRFLIETNNCYRQ
jgi:hypothetical protein